MAEEQKRSRKPEPESEEVPVLKPAGRSKNKKLTVYKVVKGWLFARDKDEEYRIPASGENLNKIAGDTVYI